ncbi:hypothetical protein ACLGI4_20980 [Streptomyces sp. HMX112]|uniref:hypothetical protein n=1 Tax=Streptomyces sp. HMX112 TaxID=3390850 RepID=UPI003A7FFA00
MGRLDDSSATLEVTGLDVVEHGRSFTVVVDLVAYGEKWRVRLPRDSSDMVIFHGQPPHHLVRGIANALHIQLFEWWHTKGSERQSSKMGERLA